jgi:predicted ester cyclase
MGIFIKRRREMKTYLCAVPVVVLLCLSFACRDKAAMAELEKYRAQAKVEEQNKQIERRYAEEEDKGNILEMIDEIVAPDVVYHYPNNNDERGLETIKQNEPSFKKAFPDMKHTIEAQIAEGDLVATRFKLRGTHRGEWMGIAPTGKELNFTLIEICRFSDGKIVEAWIELDWLGIMQQLGMELKPIAAKRK